MPVLAAMRHGKASRVGKAVRGAMNHFSHHGQRFNRTGADAGNQQQLREVRRTAVGGRCKATVQALQDDIGRSNVMVLRHQQIGQQRFVCFLDRSWPASQATDLANNGIGAQ